MLTDWVCLSQDLNAVWPYAYGTGGGGGGGGALCPPKKKKKFANVEIRGKNWVKFGQNLQFFFLACQLCCREF